jgi:adenine-specific DNA-methyltransferase
MPKINLTDEEKIELLKAVNAGLEPSPDLLPKIFPGPAEKFDVKALDRAKIPTLEYAGKRSKAAILAEAGAGIGAAPLQVVRTFGNVKKGEWQNLIVQGDNLQFLKTCYRNEDPLIKDKVKGKVKLVYIDPPFGTGDEYEGENGAKSYSARLMGSEYVEKLRERALLLWELLAYDGVIMIRIDYHFGHYAKVVCDELFLRNGYFLNEIIVNRGRNVAGAKTKLEVDNDFIFIYSNTLTPNTLNGVLTNRPVADIRWTGFLMPGDRNPPERTFFGKTIFPKRGQHFSLIQEKVNRLLGEFFLRLRCSECGAVYYLAESDYRLQIEMKKKENRFKFYDITNESLIHGTNNIDNCLECKKDNFRVDYLGSDEKKLSNIWLDIESYSKSQDYPTENSEDLLQRVLELASNEDSLIMDVFGGSGTTAAVAEKLGRRWITCDFGKHSIYTMQRRLVRIGESKAVIDEKDKEEKVIIKKGQPFGHEPKPFSVVSAGAYDFSHVMALGNPEHKDNYISFVLGLFQLGRDEDKAKKFKLTNIFADKDGSPVEVYPVWDEHYLKDVRIDEDYLKSIITQSGGRLKGEYHIITPEHCTNIGDTKIKDVTFKFLTFPYKVLEDVSRHLELHEQPASQGSVNELITSTAFYFNEDVEIELKRDDSGLKLVKFETKILNKDGNRFPGFEGLAMLLIDVDYEKGKPFDMDKTIFAKEVEEDGSFKIEDITGKSLAVIAIDKHGNESKPFILK